MYKELELSESDSMLAAYNAVCELKEETDRLLAACKAKEAELAELRGATAELFAERLEAEGLSDEAVMAAREMWLTNPESVAMVTLGCDIMEAANPWGCNQYGHRKGHGASSGGAEGSSEKPSADPREENDKARENFTRAQENYRLARKKVFDLADQIEKAARKGDTALVEKLKREQEKAREERSRASEEADRATKAWSEANRRLRSWRKQSQDSVKSSRSLEELLEEADLVKSANPYGCNQYGHEWKGKHGEGWKPRGRGGASDKKEDTQPKREAESPKEKSIEEEAKEHFEATPEQRQVIMQRWKKEVYNAKEAYERYKDYRKEGQEEYQKEKARLKAELDKAIERFREKIIESAKMRGWPLRQGQSVANTFLAQIL